MNIHFLTLTFSAYEWSVASFMELFLDFVDVFAFDSGNFSSFGIFLLGLLVALALVLSRSFVFDFFTFSIDIYRKEAGIMNKLKRKEVI